MKKLCLILLVVVSTLFFCSINAFGYKKIKCFMPQTPEIDLQGVKRIAVLDFRGNDELSRQAGKFLADRMIEYFLMENRGISDIKGFFSKKEGVTLIKGVGTKVFEVVERSRLNTVLAEQSIGEAGLVSDAEAAKIGELLGVEVILSGDVSDNREDASSREIHKTYKDNQEVSYAVNCITRKVKVAANVRIVNAKTGQILATRQVPYELTDKWCEDRSEKLRDGGEMAGVCASSVAWDLVNLINPWYALAEFELDKVKADQFKEEADNAAEAAEKYELDKAYAVYRKLYDADSYNPQFLYNMGVLYEVTGDFNKAKEMYEGAASLKDDNKYKEATKRINRRVVLVPFYANIGMAIVPYDFESAASNASLTAQKIQVKGKSQDRIEIMAEPNPGAAVVAKVPGEIQLEVISTEGEWYQVKLLGGKQGYIHKSNTKQ